MRKSKRNIYYAQIFKFDVDYVKRELKTVGIDLRYKKYFLETSREMQSSFISWSESKYEEITFEEMLIYLDRAYGQGEITERLYAELKLCEEPKLSTARYIDEVYQTIAESSIAESRRIPRISEKLIVNNNNYYVNYNYKETKSFTKFYLNRYSLNQGWCVRIAKNDIGYKLIVIYSTKKIPDLFENNAMKSFLNEYYSNPDIYYSIDVKEKQLTKWEFAYIIDLLRENNFFLEANTNMKKVYREEDIIGCTGPCYFKVLYDDIFIEGDTQNDQKEFCGVDFYGIITTLYNM